MANTPLNSSLTEGQNWPIRAQDASHNLEAGPSRPSPGSTSTPDADITNRIFFRDSGTASAFTKHHEVSYVVWEGLVIRRTSSSELSAFMYSSMKCKILNHNRSNSGGNTPILDIYLCAGKPVS